jgi:hypothetical protein
MPLTACGVEKRKGGCSAPPPFDPVSIPARHRKTRGSDRDRPGTESTGQPPFSALYRRSRNRPGSLSQGRDTGSNPVGTTQVRACIGESRLPVAPHWPRGVHGAVTDQNSVSSGECSDRVRPFKPFLQDGKEGQRAGFPAIFLVALSARRRVTMRRLHVVDGSGATAASARAASNV